MSNSPVTKRSSLRCRRSLHGLIRLGVRVKRPAQADNRRDTSMGGRAAVEDLADRGIDLGEQIALARGGAAASEFTKMRGEAFEHAGHSLPSHGADLLRHAAGLDDVDAE